MFPKIFTAIDGQMRKCFDGKRTEELLPELPPGVFDCADQWVKSGPIVPNGSSMICQIRGKIDSYVRFDDGTFAIIDFKTTAQSEDNVATYTHQLHAYAHAVENSAPGSLYLKPVSRLGLLVFEPRAFSSGKSAGEFSGSLTWTEIPRNDTTFMKLVGEVASLLSSPSIPAASPGCSWCTYRDTFRARNW